MATRQRKYDLDETARRGREMYEKKVRPLVEAGNHGRIVILDVDTGEYEVDDEGLPAAERLYARLPEAALWGERIGYPAYFRLGYHGPWGEE